LSRVIYINTSEVIKSTSLVEQDEVTTGLPWFNGKHLADWIVLYIPLRCSMKGAFYSQTIACLT